MAANRLLAQGNVALWGVIKSNTGEPLANASVLVTGSDSVKIIAFTNSDDKGIFNLVVSPSRLAQQLFIKVQLLGFKEQLVPLMSGQKKYDFVLVEAPVLLNDVVISGAFPKIKANGDTTIYRVDDFATQQDRTIGDVLKRVPGITVEDNGLIKFNGKVVKRLYLDGDDLLDDKYNLGTRTIPQRLVDEIQVLENHQAIKALEDKIYSEDVDINLTFKTEATLKVVGEGDLGGGIPGLYNEKAEAIALKKKYKAINQASFNNTGDLLSDDVLSLNDQENRRTQGYAPEQHQLSAGTVSNPAIEQNRYLFNHSGLLNTTDLWKLLSGLQIKSKAYFEYDNVHQRYQNLTNIYVPGNAVTYTELQDNVTRTRSAYADLTLQVNKPNFYLNNLLVLNYSNEADNAFLLSNGQPLAQQYKNSVTDLSNEFKLIKAPHGKVLATYYSYIHYRNAPEKLVLDSASYPLIFKTAEPLNTLSQRVNIPTFYTNNNITLHLVTGDIVQSYKIGVSAKLQHFNSDLNAYANNANLIEPDSATNAMPWNQLAVYAEPDYEWHGGNLKLVAKLPFTLQHLQFNNGLNESYNSLLFNPDISFRYEPATGIATKLFYLRNANAGNILQSYNGIVLNNYRSISENNQIFSRYNLNDVGVLFTYKNPVKIWYANLSVNYLINSSNNISYASISKDLSYTDRELYDNVNKTLAVKATVSKYVYAINMTINASATFQTGVVNQVVNGLIFPFNTKLQSYAVGSTGTLGKKLRYNYNLNYSYSNNKPEHDIAAVSQFTSNTLSNRIVVDYNVTPYFYLQGINTNLLNKNNNGLNADYNFIDFSTRFRVTKWNLDIELLANNITNITTYKAVSLSTNTQSNSEYPLRGRQLLIKATFLF